MLKRLLCLGVIVLFFSCDDGDFFVSEFNFEDDLTYCETISDVIIYKLKDSPDESLSVKMPVSVLSYFENEGLATESLSVSNTFNYRTYSGNPVDLFCNSLPPSTPVITNDSEATSGVVVFSTILEEDDADGIPSSFEGMDPNGDGDFSDSLDTDGDGVYDFIDSDDDGDNVPTLFENVDPNGDGDFSDAQDTDLDGIPDYLDDDDDGDGVLTRYEDTNLDTDPTNDITNLIVDYLDPTVVVSVINDLYLDHTKNQVFSIIITIENMVLIHSGTGEEIINENFVFGTLDNINNGVVYPVNF